MAVAAGASALGLVGAMPSGPGVIADELIAEIARSVPPPVATFLLTSETSAEGIIDHVRRCGTDTVQIVDAIDQRIYREIRRAVPRVKIVQVLHVGGAAAIEEARRLAPEVDAFLLDSGNPDLAVKELGGTGRVHDWNLSAAIVAAVDRPVFLAGGLHAGNVSEAIGKVRPFGVDLCSGVRSNGALDQAKLQGFFAAVRADA